MKSSTSPAPVDQRGVKEPVLYNFNIPKNELPVEAAIKIDASQVNPVHVTNGCTIFLSFGGNLAPKTNEASVAVSMNNELAGFANTKDVRVAINPDTAATEKRACKVFEEKGGVFGTAFGLSSALTVRGTKNGYWDSFCFDPKILRTPITDQLVVSKVKRNPNTTTVATLAIWKNAKFHLEIN